MKNPPAIKNYLKLPHHPASPLKYLCMMEPGITTRTLTNNTNPNRTIFSYTLHSRHNPSLFLRSQHLSRCPIRMTPSINTCKWSLYIFYLYLLTHWTRPLLRIILSQRNLERGNYPTFFTYSNSFYRLYPTLRTNIILRSHSHHKSSINHTIRRPNTGRMALRRIFSRQSYPNPILYTTLYTSLHTSRFLNTTSAIPT